MKQVMTICAVHNFCYPIIYPKPLPENGNESYKWFVRNRGANNRPIIARKLPEIPDNANSLSAEKLADKMALDEN